jgi:hypothetical protein
MSYDFDYYSGRHLKYPAKPTKPTLGRSPSAIEARAYADALEYYDRELDGYKEDKSYYHSQMSSLCREFEEKLRSDYAMSEGEFEVIWSEAYERGHSGGLEEVVSHFDSLYEFVKKYTSVMMMRG